jgi:hypothetical protein
MAHYHVTTDKRPGPESYATLEAARDAVGEQLEQLQAEKRSHGAEVRVEAFANGFMVTWHDEYLSGWTAIESTACARSSHERGLETVHVEIWGLSANPDGIYLISGGDAWRGGPLLAGGEPHDAVREILAANGALNDAKIIHSTSWRAEGHTIVLTYVAALTCPHVQQHWPGAQRVSPVLLEAWGQPVTHAANEPPTPTYAAVLMHALRHLEFLRVHDATAAAAMGPDWRSHLQAFTPALSGMYSREHVPEVLRTTV